MKIKIRAWDSEFGKMIYEFTPDGYFVGMQNGTLEVGSSDADGNYFILPLMQFTGLLDKNGKEIYEGDILTNGGWVGEVVYHKERLAFVLHDKDNFNELLYHKINFLTEVVGNIYENPELFND